MYARALEILTRLEDAAAAAAAPGARPVSVAADPRNAHPPGLLITPPTRTYDLSCGHTATWTIVALAPGPGNADSWQALDSLVAIAEQAVDIETVTPASYTLLPEAPPLPAMLIRFSESE